MVVEGGVKEGEEQGPSSLVRVQSFDSADIFQILVISPNQERFFGPLEQMTPFLQGRLEGQHFPVADGIVPFCRRQPSQKKKFRGGASDPWSSIETRPTPLPGRWHRSPPRTDDRDQELGGWEQS